MDGSYHRCLNQGDVGTISGETGALLDCELARHSTFIYSALIQTIIFRNIKPSIRRVRNKVGRLIEESRKRTSINRRIVD